MDVCVCVGEGVCERLCVRVCGWGCALPPELRVALLNGGVRAAGKEMHVLCLFACLLVCMVGRLGVREWCVRENGSHG